MGQTAFYETKPSNEVYAQIIDHLDFPLHLHPQMELFLVFSGEIMVTVRNQTRVLTGGDMAVIFPNEIHSYTMLMQSVSGALLHWDLSYTGGFMDLLLTNHPANPFLKTDLLHPNILFTVSEMITEQKQLKQSPAYAPLIQLLLVRLLPALELLRNKGTDYPELTYQISSFITEHYQEPITVGIMAQNLGISKSHLSHIFTEKMGQPFPSYLASIRLSNACRLLAETELSVTAVAEMTGFESMCTFFRAFKNRFHITPLKYRQNARQTP